LTEALDTTTAQGRLVFHMFGALAEFERNLIRERTQAGLAAARRAGRTGGRPRKLTEDDFEPARALLANPDIGVTQIADRLGVSPATPYRYILAARTANISGACVEITYGIDHSGEYKMLILSGVKQTLRTNYPFVYQRVCQFYEMTPHAKHKNARRAEMDNDIKQKLQARWEYELRIINEYLNADWTVRHGPFSGMKLPPPPPPSLRSLYPLATCLIGCYESQLHNWINEAIAHGYDRIIDIGCAEGYYAVGFALKSPNATVYAYDIDQKARENTAELARLNGIEKKVDVRALCTLDELNREVSDSTLIFCDIEGGEFDLLRPDLAPVLSRADLIVEMHDGYCPGVTETLARRFVPSHQVEIVYHGAKYPMEFPVLKAVPAKEYAWLLQEGRQRDQRWMRLLANQPGAVEPGKPYFLTPSLSL
jgi:hypothetical protein